VIGWECKIKFNKMNKIIISSIVFLLVSILAGCSNYEEIGGGYYTDNSFVYTENAWMYGHDYGKTKMENADLKTFKYLGGRYAKDKNEAYYQIDIVNDADINSFKALNNVYAKDARDAYYMNEKIPEADAETFNVFFADKDNWALEHYAKDDKKVYYGKKEVENADSKSFVIFTDSGLAMRFSAFAKDNKFLFYEDALIENSDPSTFKFLNNYYSKDNKNVYFVNNIEGSECLRPCIIEDADPKTFQFIEFDLSNNSENTFYARDEKFIYYNNKKIENADLETFEIIRTDPKIKIYSKDKNNVYERGRIKEGVHSDTFRL
jgi:hypothetical protein